MDFQSLIASVVNKIQSVPSDTGKMSSDAGNVPGNNIATIIAMDISCTPSTSSDDSFNDDSHTDSKGHYHYDPLTSFIT